MKTVAEQRQAIEIHDRAVLVSAGAGTGKTWTLTQRFLYLLEQHPDWAIDSIVAVTFTEKAAREMRTRIRQAVEKRTAETGDPSWQARRRDLDRMQVSTVHSLCSRILREHSIAAGIDPYFKVLDEQVTEVLKEEAVRQTLVELAESNEPGLELLVSLKVGDLQEELANLLDQRGTVKRIFVELPDEATLLERWRSGIEEMHQALWRKQKQEFPVLDDLLRTLPGFTIMDPTDKLALSVTNAQEGCRHFQAGNWSAAMQSWTMINRIGGKAGNWGGTDTLKSLKEDLKVLQDVAAVYKKAGIMDGIGPLDDAAARALQHWRSLWECLETVYTRLKDTQQALDFDDLELLTLRLLEATPRDSRLADYLNGINHLMVDEFQDTNLIQKQIAYALANPSSGGRLFVVGDAKQSIYRFRQAQVSVFSQVQTDIARITGMPAIPLNVSFRTQTALTLALNALFEYTLRPVSSEYQAFEAQPGPLQAARDQIIEQPQAPAPVELWIVPNETSDGEKVSAEDGRIFEAQILAQRLLDLERSNYQVWDKDAKSYRPFQFKDAAILFRATTSLPLYETQFKVLGLPYLTVSGRGYYDRPEIQDLIALLAALHNRHDDLNLAAALRSPLFGLSDETLYQLRWRTQDEHRSPEPVAYHHALRLPPKTKQHLEVEDAAAILNELWEMVGRTDPWRLLRRALDLTAYETTMAMNDSGRGGSGRQRSNVQKFMAFARTYGGASLSDFLRSLQDLKAREAREGEALGQAPESGAVQLMSIHASKGLEFPVVCVADIGRETRTIGTQRLLHDPTFGMVCQSRDLNGDWQKPAGYAWAAWKIAQMEEAENKRLLYVACTRAADLLILSGKDSGDKTWFAEIQQGWQITTDSVEEILGREGYSLRLIRPPYHPIESSQEVSSNSTTLSALTEIPEMARSLVLPAQTRHIAVTRLGSALSETETIHQLYPAVRRPRTPDGPMRAPHYKIGRVVHRALDDWRCLELSPHLLAERLHSIARSEGIAPAALEHAVDRSLRMLGSLRRSALYAEIQAAIERQSEVPFVINTPVGVLHGQIDLLYRLADGQWRLLDWKTDWVDPAEITEHARKEHLMQMAVYSRAIAQTLGQTPGAGVCFLSQDARMYIFSPTELAAAYNALIETRGANIATFD